MAGARESLTTWVFVKSESKPGTINDGKGDLLSEESVPLTSRKGLPPASVEIYLHCLSLQNAQCKYSLRKIRRRIDARMLTLSFRDIRESKRLPEYGNEEFGLCQSYHGVACSHLVGNRTVYVKASQTLAHLEAKLASLFQGLASTQEMKSECHMYAIPFFCFIMFPPCDETMPYPEPRHVCRDDCEILESTTCRDEISSVRRHPIIVQQDLVPNCADLPAPPQGVGGTKDGQRCISLNIPRVDHDQTCYEGRGESYRGPVKRTMSSHQCQNWKTEPDFKELSGSHNYCRNPGGVEPQPWCFISDPHIRREICDIPRCDDYSWLYILLPTATGVALLSIFIAVWCKRQKRKSCSSKLSPQRNIQLIPTHHSGHQHHRHSHHHHSSHQQIEMQKFLPCVPPCVHEVPPSSISFLHELGEGIFGKVYRGEIHHSAGSVIPVAIKTLREGASAQAQQEFSREIESISILQHQNVVCLIAVCVKEEPFCMMFEYMFQCDLHEYLLVHSPHSDVSARSEDGTPYILELSDFLAISKQIACGMEYLSSKGYVHRDLAARNCLVGAALSSPGSQTCLSSNNTQPSALSNITVKISDLGVSRNSCASDYFRIRNTLLPVRWMAPESLLYGTFTTESDVWSFGVLLWEIFSYGIQPYFNYDNQEVIDLICAHQLLPRPEYCPSYVYAIMNDCWHDSTSHRPGFKEIYNRLCSVHSLHERTYSISHSVLTHNSSHPSSTGPSNKTLSTNLSGGTVAHNTALSLVPSDISCAPSCNVTTQRTTQPMVSGSLFPFCGSTSLFVTSKIIPGHKTHQCEQV